MHFSFVFVFVFVFVLETKEWRLPIEVLWHRTIEETKFKQGIIGESENKFRRPCMKSMLLTKYIVNCKPCVHREQGKRKFAVDN